VLKLGTFELPGGKIQRGRKFEKFKEVQYSKQFEIEETGEKVTLKVNAEEALAQVDEDLFSLKVLKDCIG